MRLRIEHSLDRLAFEPIEAHSIRESSATNRQKPINNMAEGQQQSGSPTFKLVLVGDGGTGKVLHSHLDSIDLLAVPERHVVVRSLGYKRDMG